MLLEATSRGEGWLGVRGEGLLLGATNRGEGWFGARDEELGMRVCCLGLERGLVRG